MVLCIECNAEMTRTPVALGETRECHTCMDCGSLWVETGAPLDDDHVRLQKTSEYPCPTCDGVFLEALSLSAGQKVTTSGCRGCDGLYVAGKDEELLEHGLEEIPDLAQLITAVGLIFSHERGRRRKNQLPASFHVENARTTDYKCPGCDHPLTLYHVYDRDKAAGAEFEICDHCFGIWLDRHDQRDQDGRASLGLQVDYETVKPANRTCPKCRDVNLIALHFRDNPTEIDCCPVCFGTWLDGGELEEFCRFLGKSDHDVIDALVDNAIFRQDAFCRTLSHFSRTLYQLDARVQEQSKNMAQARDIQEKLLFGASGGANPGEHDFGPYKVMTWWQPARAVGGDYFDLIPLEIEGRSCLGVCVADVSGKGLPASLLMANFQALLRSFAPGCASPAELCAQLNTTLYHNTGSGKYITACYGILDLESGRFTWCNAGHNRPFLLRDDKPFWLDSCGTVLGLFPAWSYEEKSVELDGDRLLLYTDGVSELENGEGEEFGEDRLFRMLYEQAGRVTADAHRLLVRGVVEFGRGEFQDDATLILVENVVRD